MQPALFIQGQWRSGQGAQLNKTNPADNTLLWSALSASAEDVGAACTAARTAFPAWARKTVTQRAEVIKRFADLLTEHKTRLAEIISQETSKPRWETLTEIQAMIGKVAISLEACQQRTG